MNREQEEAILSGLTLHGPTDLGASPVMCTSILEKYPEATQLSSEESAANDVHQGQRMLLGLQYGTSDQPLEKLCSHSGFCLGREGGQ